MASGIVISRDRSKWKEREGEQLEQVSWAQKRWVQSGRGKERGLPQRVCGCDTGSLFLRLARYWIGRMQTDEFGGQDVRTYFQRCRGSCQMTAE